MLFTYAAPTIIFTIFLSGVPVSKATKLQNLASHLFLGLHLRLTNGLPDEVDS